MLGVIAASRRKEYIFQPEIQGIIDRAVLEDFAIPSQTTLKALDFFVKVMIEFDLWDGFDQLFNFAYNNDLLSDFSRINIRHPEDDLMTIYGGVTYSDDGFKGNGVDGYLMPHFIPMTNSVKYTMDNAGRGVYAFDNESGKFFGNTDNGSYNSMWNSNTVGQRLNGNNLDVAVDFSTDNFKSMYRDDSINLRCYSDDEYFATSQSIESYSDKEYSILRSSTTGYSKIGLSMVFFSRSFSKIENNKLKSEYKNYLTKIGLTTD